MTAPTVTRRRRRRAPFAWSPLRTLPAHLRPTRPTPQRARTLARRDTRNVRRRRRYLRDLASVVGAIRRTAA